MKSMHISDPPYQFQCQINTVFTAVSAPSSCSLIFKKFTPELCALLLLLASHGLDNTGADNNTTHDPSIIHDLCLLPENRRNLLEKKKLYLIIKEGTYWMAIRTRRSFF